MKKTTPKIIAFLLPASAAITVHAEQENPYANMQPYQGGYTIQQLQQQKMEQDRQKKERDDKRAAIEKKIAAEELAKAKAAQKAGSWDDPYAVANVETRKRMKPYYDKWKKEDEAEKAISEQQRQAYYQQMMQTNDPQELARQQMEMLRKAGLAPPEK